MRAEWARSIREQCRQAGVAFFFKQWGAYDEAGIRRGKKASGRCLDGRTWDELPLPKARVPIARAVPVPLRRAG
jgi:protein gp37